MPQGASIHIGLNNIDTTSPAYQGVTASPLSGCWNDAASMEKIAEKKGYATRLKLLDSEATAERVLGELTNAANTLVKDDILLVSYSGHGSQMDDSNGDESDAKDETWVLWDRMISDDEISGCWDSFAEGVRIVLISDSCHSGTVSREIYQQAPNIPGLREIYAPLMRDVLVAVKTRGGGTTAIESKAPDVLPVRSLTHDASVIAQSNMKRLKLMPTMRRMRAAGGATVILLSGCQDNQLSADGSTNGLFTEKLLEVWADDTFTDGYSTFLSAIVAKMPPTQTPNYSVTGASNSTFEAEIPFTVVPVSQDTGDGTEGSGETDGSVDGFGEDSTDDTTDDTFDDTTDDTTDDTFDDTTDDTSDDTTDDTSDDSFDDTTENGEVRDAGRPRVNGPSKVSPGAPPPTFSVDKGTNRYYAFEIAGDPQLFAEVGQRAPGSWYASWEDPAAPAWQTDDRYVIPAAAWSKLAAKQRLYYRVCTSSSESSWQDYETSTLDDDGAHAPVLQIG